MNEIEKYILHIESDITQIEFKLAQIKRTIFSIQLEVQNKSKDYKKPQTIGTNFYFKYLSK